jgi:hypothetical protein
LSYSYYNAVTSAGMLFDERHPSNSVANGGFSNAEHRYHHLKDGTQYISGLAFSGYGPAATSADMTYAVASGIIVDEDIWHNIGPVAGYAVPENGPYRVMYRSGPDANSEWVWDDSNTYGIAVSGTDLAYNQNNGGVWQLTPIGSVNHYVNYWLVAMPCLDNASGSAGKQVVAIPSTSEHSTLQPALDEGINAIAWGINPQEFVVFGKITYKRGATAGDTYYANIEQFAYVAGNPTSFVSSGVSPSDHQSLSNRTAIGAHPATSISTVLTGPAVSASTNVNNALNILSNVTINSRALSGNVTTPDTVWAPFTNTNMIAGTALGVITSGSYNVAIQSGAGSLFESSSHNVAIGLNTLANNRNGDYNVAIGYEAIKSAISSAGQTTGHNNVAIGRQSQVHKILR